MPLTKERLQYHVGNFLKAFNDEGIPTDSAGNIPEETVIGSLVSTSQEQGIFKNSTMLTMRNGGLNAKKRWTKNWPSLTFKALIESLVIFMLFISPAAGQLQFNVGAVKTADKNAAVSVGVKYAMLVDSSWGSKELFAAGNNSIFTISPEFDLQTGTQDAFSWINFKMTGLFTKFKTVDDDGIAIPDLTKTVQTFPVSIGGEANNTFTTINGIVEAGWVPWYQSATSNAPAILKATKFGIYLQGGYKFKADSGQAQAYGGNKDQSLEKVQSNLLRAKGSFSIDTKNLIKTDNAKISLVGNADVWYDFVNRAFYHKIQGIGRFHVTNDSSIDFVYAKGSGAPNFNSEDQYGVGLTIKF